MHRYDPDLIAALADGTLDPAEAARLEAEIADNPEVLAEVAQQRAALAAMREAARPALTDAESLRVRAAVAEALGFQPAVQAAQPKRRISWSAVAVAGVALAALIGFVPLVGLLNTGNGGGDAAAVSIAEDVINTRAAVPEASESAPVAGDEGDDFAATTLAATAEENLPPVDTSTVATDGATAGGEAAALDLDVFIEDPEAMAYSVPASADTPCRTEAIAALGADDVLVVDTTDEYIVFGLIDETGTPVRLVAFSPLDCSRVAELP